jgi:transcription elongation factor GreA
MKTIRRPQIAERLKEAISYGDLSENAEYETAREEQSTVEARIAEIEDILKKYTLIDEDTSKTLKVRIGSVVTIRSISEDEIVEDSMKIVGSIESDIFENKISNESPIGSALIGRKLNEVVSVKSPSGQQEYTIVAIK